MTVKPPHPEYRGPAAHTSAGSNFPLHRVVIHSTVGPSHDGARYDLAAFFRTPGAGGSAHYVVDAGGVVQVVGDHTIAWHAPPNQGSIGIEMCDDPSPSSSVRWKDAMHVEVLRRTARLTARLCAAYDVPPVFLDVPDLKAGKHGITTHHNVSQAFHQSTHWDPGAWPRDEFMQQVKNRFDTLKGRTS